MSTHIDRTGLRDRFWEKTALEDLSKPEWEALCDGCGRCCLIKMEDEDTEDIYYTNVTCRLFDIGNCTCSSYALRRQLVKDCVSLTPENIDRNAHWMPSTCAYRLLHEGKPLFDWHPLISGSNTSVHEAYKSVAGLVVPEYEVEEEDLVDHMEQRFR
ncbi:MAG: YcgN family cysteine cluster protein [Rhodobacteraceae bacterium]|nr:YcgN family cysteine cluster protein [Paracoccaceae bacterium]